MSLNLDAFFDEITSGRASPVLLWGLMLACFYRFPVRPYVVAPLERWIKAGFPAIPWARVVALWPFMTKTYHRWYVGIIEQNVTNLRQAATENSERYEAMARHFVTIRTEQRDEHLAAIERLNALAQVTGDAVSRQELVAHIQLCVEFHRAMSELAIQRDAFVSLSPGRVIMVSGQMVPGGAALLHRTPKRVLVDGLARTTPTRPVLRRRFGLRPPPKGR